MDLFTRYLIHLAKQGGGGTSVITVVNSDGSMNPSQFNELPDGLYYIVQPLQRMHGDISAQGLVSKNSEYVNNYDYGHFFGDFNGTSYSDYGSIDGFGLEEARTTIGELEEKINQLELFKFPNLTIHGQPSINHGQVSGFTVNDYLQFPFLVDFQNRAFTINMCFTTGPDVVNQQNIIDSEFGLAFAVINRRFVLAISSNGTSWDLGADAGTFDVLPNTVYYVKVSWNKLVYKVEYSLDGRDYILDISKTAAVPPYPRNIMVGVGDMHTDHPHAFGGVINLNYANLYIGNELIWQGMDDVGLATRLAVDMSNIDDVGKEVVRNLAPVQEVQANGVSVVQDGVANIPLASSSEFGVVKVDGRGLQQTTVGSTRILTIQNASNAELKNQIVSYKPPSASTMHIATYWGLLKAAGIDTTSSHSTVGNPSKEEQEAVQSMLGIPVWHEQELSLADTEGSGAYRRFIVRPSDGMRFGEIEYFTFVNRSGTGETTAQFNLGIHDTPTDSEYHLISVNASATHNSFSSAGVIRLISRNMFLLTGCYAASASRVATASDFKFSTTANSGQISLLRRSDAFEFAWNNANFVASDAYLKICYTEVPLDEA